MEQLIPDVEENVPFPASALEAMPPLSPREELEMRARTVKMIADLNGQPIEVGEANRTQAMDIAESIFANKTNADLATYPNETLAYLAGMVAQYDTMIVREFADLKKYVVNKLIQETDNPDAKIRIAAIKALGEVDGVDAFKKRTEVTVKQQSMDEVERELIETLNKLRSRAIDVEVIEIKEEADETND